MRNNPGIIQLGRFHDHRGTLTVVEGGASIPFSIERAFWITDVPSGRGRGGHAHRRDTQLLVAVSGSFTLILDDGESTLTYRLDNPSEGLLVPPASGTSSKTSPRSRLPRARLRPLRRKRIHPRISRLHSLQSKINMADFLIKRYMPEFRREWNDFVETSKNGTFLLNRDYMDYHSDRFPDCSLTIFRNGKLFALLPASASADVVCSHPD